MNRLIIILFSVFSLYACSSENKKNRSREKDTTVVYKISKSNLIGVWWDSNDLNSPTASFEINDTTVFYSDQENPEYKYSIKNDSLIIYFDGFKEVSKIDKATKDSLVLTSNSGTTIYIKEKI